MIDGLFRQKTSSGRLKLVAKKPVVLVLGTGWGAHSLVKVREGGWEGWARCTDAGTPAACLPCVLQVCVRLSCCFLPGFADVHAGH